MTPVTIVPELEESRRDAMVAYHLGHMEDVRSHRVMTPEDLYEYLLIDPMVGAAVDASDVTMAVASLQQYVNAILAGMEPGYSGVLPPGEQRDWRDRRGQYALWAGNQMLQNYPENYLDPTLRLKQTRGFREFVNDTNQGRISDESVRLALVKYVDAFEDIANLRVVGGYCDRTDIRNADYYFIGRSATEPAQYYWRKLEVRLGDASDADDVTIPATAWSEWERIDIPATPGIVAIRPVLFNNRVCVAWLEHTTSQKPGDAASQGLAETIHHWTFKVSWRRSTGTWAVPMSWESKKGNEVGEKDWGDESPSFVAFASNDVEGRRRLVLAARRGGTGTEFWRFVSVDEFYDIAGSSWRVPSEGAEELARAWLADYGATNRTVQLPPFPLSGLEQVTKIVHESGPSATGLHIDLSIYTLSPALRITCIEIRSWLQSLHEAGTVLTESLVYDGTGETCHSSQVRAHASGLNLSTLGATLLHRVPLTREDSFVATVEASFGDEVFARLKVACSFVERTVTLDAPDVVSCPGGGQFLDITSLYKDPKNIERSHIRMDTGFGKYLADRISRSTDALLNWDTQSLAESEAPAGAKGVSAVMDFDGANGRYFWELFFHTPHMIAWRMNQDFMYREAEQWLNYIFDPTAKFTPGTTASPEYWRVRPLSEPGDASYEFDGLVDPDAICYAAPVHYRKAIFVFYVKNLIGLGDQLYRRLTRDSLSEAKLTYVRALGLMGPKPDFRMIGRWEPLALSVAAAYDTESLVAFEASLPSPSRWGEATVKGTPWFDLLDAERFRMPLNTLLLGVWDEIALRIGNLRHHLTIDGKPIMIPLYDSPINPLDLLRAQNSAGGLSQRGVGGLASIPPYRFRAMLSRVQEAVSTLIRFGDDVRVYRELKDRSHQEEMQQGHMQDLAQFAIGMSEVAYEQAVANVASLEASKRVRERRRALLEDLIVTDLSVTERQSEEAKMSSLIAGTVVGGMMTAASAIQMTSITITAFGGGHSRAGAALAGGAEVARMLGEATRWEADRLGQAAQYERRRQQWQHDKELAVLEEGAIDKQVEALRLSIKYSAEQLSQARKARTQAEEHYTFLKTRSTNEGLYNWLVSQMSTLYFQAYDAVVALCLSTEAAWQYEMGDYASRFIQPDVWFDNYHGLTAGASLKMQLMRMEAAHLKRHERRLELVRTISLKSLCDGWPSSADGMTGEAAIRSLVEKGTLQFNLPQALFDHDYPGHYLRQIVSVSVSLPLVVGAYQDVKATLTQVASTTMLKADVSAARFLYAAEGGKADALLYNPRVSQSIGLSHGVDDAGMHVVNFYDERYLPFEGTGAVSIWELKFPRHDKSPQKEMLATLNDVILRISYTAVDGGPQFAEAVEALVDEAMKPPKPSDP